MSDAHTLLRALPSMDVVLTALYDGECAEYAASLPRPLLRTIVTRFFDNCRDAVRKGDIYHAEELALERLIPRLIAYIRKEGKPRFRRVLNATGVVIHTNLGRSLLPQAAITAIHNAAAAYSNLEFDLGTGERGSRYSHVEGLICTLCGAEAALVVNNNAAAVLLILDTLCKGREVVVSRGELVEIGGSFRIPAVMEKSGCILKEVGATNRTHPADYETAMGPETAAIMKVHTSNYRIVGFHSEVPLKELAAIAATHNVPLIEDLGGGNLFDYTAAGLPVLDEEPRVQHSLASGADIVSFSGDKMLGGPQAGIIAGKKLFIDQIKKNHMNRALRIDKMTLAALEATLRLYLDPALAAQEIPTLRMLLLTREQLQISARKLLRRLQKKLSGMATVTLVEGSSRVGGGALPEAQLPTTLIVITSPCCSASELRQRLLATDLPLAGRIEDNSFMLDPRTLADEEHRLVAASLYEALTQTAHSPEQYQAE